MGSVRKPRGEDRTAKPPPGEIALTAASGSQPTPVHVETSMGTLALFPQRFEDIGAFSKLPIDAPSSSRLRLYLPHIAARSDASVESGEWPRLDEASSRQLGDEDLERIAEAYLSMPERCAVAKPAGPASAPIVRADGESAIAYLDRLLKAEHERQMADLERTYESMQGKSAQALAGALADVDRQASVLRDVATRSTHGDDLAEQKRRTERDASATPTSLEGHRPLLFPDAGVADTDGARRVDDEAMALMRSIGLVTTQSAMLIASLSETTTRFLREFSETTQKSQQAAHTSARTVLIAVLIIGAFALIAAAAAIVNYFDLREDRQTTQASRELVLRSMKDTADAQAAQIQSLDDRVRELSARQGALATAPTLAASDAAAQKVSGEAPVQGSPKPSSPKRGSKRKPAR